MKAAVPEQTLRELSGLSSSVSLPLPSAETFQPALSVNSLPAKEPYQLKYHNIHECFQRGDYTTALELIALVDLFFIGSGFLNRSLMREIIDNFVNKNVAVALEYIEKYLQDKPAEFPLLIRQIACLLKLNRIDEARDVIILTMRLSLQSQNEISWRANWVYGWCLYFLALAEADQSSKLELFCRAIVATNDCDVRAFAAWEIMRIDSQNTEYAQYERLANGYSRNRPPIIPLNFFEE